MSISNHAIYIGAETDPFLGMGKVLKNFLKTNNKITKLVTNT